MSLLTLSALSAVLHGYIGIRLIPGWTFSRAHDGQTGFRELVVTPVAGA